MGVSPALGVASLSPPPAGDRANTVLAGAFAAVGPSLPVNVVGWCNLSIWASFNTTLTTTAGSTAATVASAGTIQAGNGVNGANVPAGTTVGAIAGTAVTLALPTLSLTGHLRSGGQISQLTSTAGLLGAAVSGPGVPAGATVSAILTAAVQQSSYSGAPPTLGVVQLSSTATTDQTYRDLRQAFNFAPTGAAVKTGADTAALFTGIGISASATVNVERSFDGGKTFVPFSISLSVAPLSFGVGSPVSTTFSEPESGVLYRCNCTVYASGVVNYRLSTTGTAGLTLPTGGNI